MNSRNIVFTRENEAELLTEEMRPLAPHEVMVKLAISSISSGTERANLTGSKTVSWLFADQETAIFPRRSGYSSAGVVEQVGEAVTIPRYNARTGENVWNICRAILLYTGSVIYLENCHLRHGDDCVDNLFRNSNTDTPLGYTREGRQSDITIMGIGSCLLDGGDYPGVTEENYRELGMTHNYGNCMFHFVNVERVKISNIRITRQRYWSMVFHYSSHVQIRDIDYNSPWQCRNQDGIDLRSGCSHFLIENITGVTGDDVVAMTNLRNQYMIPMAECGYDDSIHNVIIQNIRASTRHSFVRILNHGGRKIYNILVDNLIVVVECLRKV